MPPQQPPRNPSESLLVANPVSQQSTFGYVRKSHNTEKCTPMGMKVAKSFLVLGEEQRKKKVGRAPFLTASATG